MRTSLLRLAPFASDLALVLLFQLTRTKLQRLKPVIADLSLVSSLFLMRALLPHT